MNATTEQINVLAAASMQERVLAFFLLVKKFSVSKQEADNIIKELLREASLEARKPSKAILNYTKKYGLNASE